MTKRYGIRTTKHDALVKWIDNWTMDKGNKGKGSKGISNKGQKGNRTRKGTLLMTKRYGIRTTKHEALVKWTDTRTKEKG